MIVCYCISIGGEDDGHEAHLSLVPIHIVTHASQLPIEFLSPSPEKQLVVGFDCEGVDLCRYGTLCIMQVIFFCLTNLISSQLCTQTKLLKHKFILYII